MLQIHGKNPIKLKSNSINKDLQNQITLGEKQMEVLFCLALGLQDDKSIAGFISKVRNTICNPVSIKRCVQVLFKKFDVQSRDSLIDFIISEKIYAKIPNNFIKKGSYIIDDSLAIVNR